MKTQSRSHQILIGKVAQR